MVTQIFGELFEVFGVCKPELDWRSTMSCPITGIFCFWLGFIKDRIWMCMMKIKGYGAWDLLQSTPSWLKFIRWWVMGGPYDFRVSPSPLGLDFGLWKRAWQLQWWRMMLRFTNISNQWNKRLQIILNPMWEPLLIQWRP